MKQANDPRIAALPPEEREKRLLSTAGLAARAGKAVIGTNLICDTLRRGEWMLILEAGDSAENTHKRLSDRAAYYGVPLYRLSLTGETLAAAFGKTGILAAVGITDRGMVRAFEKYLPQPLPSERNENRTL